MSKKEDEVRRCATRCSLIFPKLITVFKGARLPDKELGFSGSSFSEKRYFNGPICQPGITHRLCTQSGVSNNVLLPGRKAERI